MELIKACYPKSALMFERAYKGALSRTKAIHAKCLECSNHVREEINSCTVDTCPLWAYRPRYGADKGKQLRRKVLSPAHQRALVSGKKSKVPKTAPWAPLDDWNA